MLALERRAAPGHSAGIDVEGDRSALAHPDDERAVGEERRLIAFDRPELSAGTAFDLERQWPLGEEIVEVPPDAAGLDLDAVEHGMLVVLGDVVEHQLLFGHD